LEKTDFSIQFFFLSLCLSDERMGIVWCQDCQICLDKIYQNGEKIPQHYLIVIKYNNIFKSKALQNFPQIGIFGLKIYHLATLFGA
jgi:hypothetical protein